MIPSHFVLLDAFPRTPAGKTDRAALPAPEKRGGVEERVPPRDAVERKLVEIWTELLHVSPIGVRDDFFDLGGHSLMAARLFSRIAQAFGRGLPMSTLFRAPTVESLAQFLRETRTEAELYSTLVPIHAEGSLPPLFYMHEIRGNVAGSHLLALVSRQLGQEQPIYAFQAVGLDGAEPPHTSLREMAAHYVAEIRKVRPDGPYHVGGFSFGGVVAYEVACQLRASGLEVGAVLLLDTYFPAYFASAKGTVSRVAYHWKQLTRGQDRAATVQSMWRSLKRRVFGRILRVADSIYERMGEADAQRRLTVLEANLQALKSWEPQIYPGRITLLRSAERSVDPDFDPRSGWARKAAGGVQVIDIPGQHATMLRDPNVRLVAQRVAETIQAAARSAAPGPRDPA